MIHDIVEDDEVRRRFDARLLFVLLKGVKVLHQLCFIAAVYNSVFG
jgi:hypothetical protein